MGFGKKFKKALKKAEKKIKSAGRSIDGAFHSSSSSSDPVEAAPSPVAPPVTSGTVDRTPTDLIGDSANSMTADQLNADIMRKKWDQFEQSDMPYIMKYANRVVGGQDTVDAVNQARGGVNRGFEIADQAQQRSDASLGLGLSNAQQVDRKADVKRSQTAALVDAENSAWTAGKDRENALLAGSHMPKAQGR